MLLEDVMEVLTLLLLQDFIDQFVFIWGHEQYVMTLSQFIVGNYYCLKDLNHVYFACQGLPYGKEDQTLLINDEWTKLFEIPRKVFFFKSVIEDISSPRIRGNGWTSRCGCGQRW
jgi:hypothetical protein